MKKFIWLPLLVWGSLLSTMPNTKAEAKAVEKVTVGAFINDIQLLDVKEHNFTADIYIWFRWRNPKLNPAKTFEYMNPFELWGHSTKATYDDPIQLPSGEFYQIVRTHGRFSQKFILDNYPFDRQLLHIGIEDTRSEDGLLEFVPDENPVTFNPSLRLPGFVIDTPSLRIVHDHYPTNFGDTRLEGAKSSFSHVNIEIPIHRPLFAYAVKFLLPIICVVFAAGLMFLFSPNYVDSRVGIGITALLTIVALQITLNEDLPQVDYLVLIDKIYLCAYLYVIAGLAVIVKTTWMIAHDSSASDRAERLDRQGLMWLTIIYMASIIYFIYPAITLRS